MADEFIVKYRTVNYDLRLQVDELQGEIVRLRAVLDAERALADQLAEALRDAHGTATRHAVCWCSTDSEYPSDCDSTIALAAYEEARRG